MSLNQITDVLAFLVLLMLCALLVCLIVAAIHGFAARKETENRKFEDLEKRVNEIEKRDLDTRLNTLEQDTNVRLARIEKKG